MRNQRQKCTAIKGLLFAALLLMGSLAWAAQVAGTVVHLSGPLMAKKADGTVKVLALKSEVESGDTLVSERNTYAQIKFVDNSEITLRPGTTFKVENFAFDAGKPEGDNAAFSLVKGGLRSITGLLGKRNKEKFMLRTPSATIGIRGTTFIVQYVEPSVSDPNLTRQELMMQPVNGGQAPAEGKQLPQERVGSLPDQPPPSQGKSPSGPAAPVLPPGMHVQVLDGMIVVTNNGGSLGFQAGQFGYVPSPTQPPVIVPPNPGLQFTPPPAFNRGATATGPSAAVQDQNAVDCIVR